VKTLPGAPGDSPGTRSTPARRAAEDALLCEACGYVIDGLPPDGACPECGRSVASSMPEARPGTPWQRGRPGPFAWAATAWAVLRRPGPTFERLRLVPGTGTGLAIANLAVASALLVGPWIGVTIHDPARLARGGGDTLQAVTYVWVIVAGVGTVTLILFALMVVEFMGVRFMAGRRRWRLPREAAWLVCCHASIGWVFSGIGSIAALAGGHAVLVLFGAAPGGRIYLGPALGPVSWQAIVYGGGVVAGWALGMIVFETLVYIGVRRCRYATPLRSGR